MTLVLPYFFGFIAAIVGVLPPGLINLTAAKISLNHSKKQAFQFVLGAVITIFFQTYISVLFARLLDQNQQIVIVFREIGFVIFSILTLYFFKFAKKPTLQQTTESNNVSNFLLSGIGVAAIDVFPIPYYVFVSISMASYSVFSFQTAQILSLVLGVVTGSALIFYCYVVFFNRLKQKTKALQNMNKIIGSITGIVALATLFNLLKYYFHL
jgi:threonine/homoserine/homoserine lactone efflux protein